jgi:hypothetical protein
MLIMYANIILNVFLQMRDFNVYDTFSMASLVMAVVFLAISFAIIALLMYKIISFFN